MRELAGIAALLAGLWPAAADAGFRTPESLVRNVYAHYGAEVVGDGRDRDAASARQFFDPSLRRAWSAPRVEPYDFLVQSPNWKLGPVAIAVVRRQYDKTYVAANFDNRGRKVTLNFVLVNGPEGWLITDVESPHDSLRMFLEQFRK